MKHSAGRITAMSLLIAAALSLSAGCSSMQSPASEAQRALDSCLFPDKQVGWSLLQTPPDNLLGLQALVRAKWPHDPGLDDKQPVLWFSHRDGRLLACSHVFASQQPEICGASTIEFIPSGKGWSLGNADVVICHAHRLSGAP